LDRTSLAEHHLERGKYCWGTYISCLGLLHKLQCGAASQKTCSFYSTPLGALSAPPFFSWSRVCGATPIWLKNRAELENIEQNSPRQAHNLQGVGSVIYIVHHMHFTSLNGCARARQEKEGGWGFIL